MLDAAVAGEFRTRNKNQLVSNPNKLRTNQVLAEDYSTLPTPQKEIDGSYCGWPYLVLCDESLLPARQPSTLVIAHTSVGSMNQILRQLWRTVYEGTDAPSSTTKQTAVPSGERLALNPLPPSCLQVPLFGDLGSCLNQAQSSIQHTLRCLAVAGHGEITRGEESNKQL